MQQNDNILITLPPTQDDTTMTTNYKEKNKPKTVVPNMKICMFCFNSLKQKKKRKELNENQNYKQKSTKNIQKKLLTNKK